MQSRSLGGMSCRMATEQVLNVTDIGRFFSEKIPGVDIRKECSAVSCECRQYRDSTIGARSMACK